MYELIGYILFFLFMVMCGTTLLLWFFHCRKPGAYNGFLWVHPDKGGDVIGIKKDPLYLQKPFQFNYHILEFGLPFFRRPLYLWQQDKIDDGKGNFSYPIIPWEPTIPADYMLQSTADGEPDKTRPYVTPNQLYNTCDWSALRTLETAPKGWHEAVKTGAAVVLACVCILGIIMTIDMIGKKDPAQPVQTTSKPAAMIIQPQNYGGLEIW